MKRIALISLLALLPAAVEAKPAEPSHTCPGTTTVEMRACAGESLVQSGLALSKQLPQALLKQWKETTLSVCTKAYAPYKDGSIYPQLLIGCADQLNKALLNEFKPMDAR